MSNRPTNARTDDENEGLGHGVPVLHCESIGERCAQNNWKIDAHARGSLSQFLWIGSGGGRAVIGGARYALAAPTALHVTPRTAHEFTFEPDTKGWIVTAPERRVNGLFAHEAQLGGDLATPTVFRPHDPEALGGLFANVASEHQSPQSAREDVLGAWLTLIVCAFTRAAEARRAQAEAGADRRLVLVRRFRKLLDGLDGKKAPLTEIAESLGVTTTHLTRVCRETTGRPASAMIEARVIAAAKRDLVFAPITVAEVGYRLGFADPAHFSKFFSQRVGSTPSGFRDMMRRRLEAEAPAEATDAQNA